MNSKTVNLKGPIQVYDGKGNVLGTAESVSMSVEVETEEYSFNGFGPQKIAPIHASTSLTLDEWKEILAPQAKFDDFYGSPPNTVVVQHEGIELQVTKDPMTYQHKFVLKLDGKFGMVASDEFLEGKGGMEYVQQEMLSAVANAIQHCFEGFEKGELTPKTNPFITPPLTESTVLGKLKKLFPNLGKKVHLCPVKSCKISITMDSNTGEKELKRFQANVWTLVQHLNDQHHWSREQIAEWLETIDEDITLKEG